jgi:NAD(P)-dependent dehydrogenase (short-subunit alcohol dehydrogenase family)
VALVTGAAQRIGREITLDLAAPRLGRGRCTTAVRRLPQRRPWPTLHDLGAPAAAFAADLADDR